MFIGGSERDNFYPDFPLCYFVIYFVSFVVKYDFYVPQRNTKAGTKVHFGLLFNRIQDLFLYDLVHKTPILCNYPDHVNTSMTRIHTELIGS